MKAGLILAFRPCCWSAGPNFLIRIYGSVASVLQISPVPSGNVHLVTWDTEAGHADGAAHPASHQAL